MLKGCPFCDGEELSICSFNQDDENGEYLAYSISCENCGLQMVSAFGETENDLIERWNTRSNSAFDEDKNPLIFVEEGSVDVDALIKMNFRPIVYKRGSAIPVIIKDDKRI